MEKNREINIKNIDCYNELFDKGCMILVEKGNKKNYLDAFNSLASYICEESINSLGLDNRAINSLNKVIEKIYNLEILNEEVREALILNIVKGLKHSDLPLEYVTPDILVYLYSHIIEALYNDECVTIMDTNVGMGILMNGIINNLNKEVEYIGTSTSERAINVASSLTNLCMNEARLFNNDPMNEGFIVSANVCLIDNMRALEDTLVDNDNLSKYDIYDYIIKYNKMSDYSICLIDNDFFTSNKASKFKSEFKGTMLGLICLPKNLFKEGKEKSILILSNKHLDNYDVSVFQIPELNDTERVKKVFSQMNYWLDNISYKNIYNE